MMGRSRGIWLALCVIVLVAGALRVYRLRDVPAGLFCDEAAMGYNAYTLGRWGIDENGRQLPLYIWSFGVSYKNPAYIYPAIVPVKLLGLNETSTRLPAALFGLGTVVAVFFLGRALAGPWVGLWSALFLALCPWHLHFSRIAFELISFPFLFVLGATLLFRYTQGRRTLPAAFFFFSLCVYSYAISALFVPAFVAGFGLLYLPDLLRRWRQTLLAVVVAAATVAPAAVFHLRNPQAGTVYFRQTTMLKENRDWPAQVRSFARNYAEFFSPKFLFQTGDPLVRHAVRGEGRFGELLPFYAPFLLIGAAVLLLWPDRLTKLMLWWLAWYPVGASLMTEIPSATRSIIGVPAFCVLTGVGFAACLKAVGWVLRWRPLALAGQAAAVAAAGYFLAPEASTYLREYFVEYPKYAAPTPGGFQYGFREAIEYMESQRGHYDRMLISTTDGNQNHIFPLFYLGSDPNVRPRMGGAGYELFAPEFYKIPEAGAPRALSMLHPSDLDLFSDFVVKRRIIAPGGQETFVIAELRARKRYLSEWLALGLFPNPDNENVGHDFIDVSRLTRGSQPGRDGEIEWRRMPHQEGFTDFNRYFAGQDRRSPGNPEWSCAYALATVVNPVEREVYLELAGSDDPVQVWLNGRSLTFAPLMLGKDNLRRKVRLRSGENLLVVQSCESVGSWAFSLRLTDDAGRDLTDIRNVAEFPERTSAQLANEQPLDLQLIEGFESIVRYKHVESSYPDHRDSIVGWSSQTADRDAGVAWKTAPCPERKRTVAAFTASMGGGDGRADLYVNDEKILTFDTGENFATRRWSAGEYQLMFVRKKVVHGASGFFLLSVPPQAVRPGEPLEIRVSAANPEGTQWFLVRGYRDTIAYSGLTPMVAADALSASWDVVARP